MTQIDNAQPLSPDDFKRYDDAADEAFYLVPRRVASLLFPFPTAVFPPKPSPLGLRTAIKHIKHLSTPTSQQPATGQRRKPPPIRPGIAIRFMRSGHTR